MSDLFFDPSIYTIDLSIDDDDDDDDDDDGRGMIDDGYPRTLSRLGTRVMPRACVRTHSGNIYIYIEHATSTTIDITHASSVVRRRGHHEWMNDT